MGKHACIPRSVVLPKQQVGGYCDNFPPCGLQGKYFPHHVVLVYSLLDCQTVVQILHHFTVTVNDVEVTVHLHMYRYVYNNNNKGPIRWAGGQGFMTVVNKPRLWAMPSDLTCLLP